MRPDLDFALNRLSFVYIFLSNKKGILMQLSMYELFKRDSALSWRIFFMFIMDYIAALRVPLHMLICLYFELS